MPRPKTPRPTSKLGQRTDAGHGIRPAHPTVSGRWLVVAVSIAVVTAAACGWLTLCLLFWQGSWQLLYHPVAAVSRTPAAVQLPYVAIDFANSGAGAPQLHGWWIPGPGGSRLTALYLHGASGNIGNSVDSLAPLRAAQLNIFAFDYHGYGLSQFARPSEARWRADADSAIDYLTNTRHIPAASILLFGEGLGANLALEVGAAHPQLGGIVMIRPLNAPAMTIFNDPRARLVPARLLMRDRWNVDAAASTLLIPSLWIFPAQAQASEIGRDATSSRTAYDLVTARKQEIWTSGDLETLGPELTRWLDDLPAQSTQP